MNKNFSLKNKKIISLYELIVKFFCFTFVIAFAEMLFSCSSALEDSYYSKNSKDSPLSVIINNYDFYNSCSVAANDNARLIIAPSTYSISGISKFLIEGMDTTNPSNTISQEISINSSGEGTISDITKSFWIFTLHAYSDSDMTNEVLKGSASVDTSQYASVAFTLSSEGLTTPGSCEIALDYDSNYASFFDDMVGEIHINLCKAITLEIVKELAVITTETDLDSFIDGSGYLIEESTIAPGAYIMTMYFYQIANSTASKIGFFSAGFIVEPGRCTTQTVTIPHIIATIPDAPENLVVYRDDSTLTADSYNAVVRWDDVSNNEEYFQLVIREYDSDSATTGTRTILNASTTDYSNFYSSKTFSVDGVGYVSGNLFYSSEEIVVKLATGKLYDFEIYAVNTYGSSAACIRSESSDIAEDAAFGSMTGFAEPGDSNPYMRVNTFTLSYALENGKLITSLGNAFTGQTYIEYKIYTGTATSLMLPATIVDPDDSSFSAQGGWPVCYYGSLSQGWTKWVKNGSSAAVTSVSSFTNQTFYAEYDIELSPAIYFDDSAMYVTYGSTANSSLYGTGTALSSGGSVSTGYVTITIDRNSSPNSVFTRYDFYVNGSQVSYNTDVGSNTLVSYTIPFLFNGTFTLQVSGSYNEQYFYSKEFSLTVE